MLSGEILYRVGLTLIDGVGDVLARQLIAYCGSAEAVFTAKPAHLEKIPGIGQVLARAVARSKFVLQRAEEELAFIEKHRIQPLFFTDAAYPQRLRHCHDSPAMLYYKGSADLNAPRVIAVVGSRTPTAYGKECTERFLAELAHSPILVVSGLAYGIDIAAHKAAYNHGLDTVGVLAHGLDRIYPQAHRSMAEKMLKQGGLLTDFMSGTNPDRENFPSRNRIVAGLCDALVVIESKKEGGSLITATIANSYNRDVFAFPGRSGDVMSEGCNGLIKSNKAGLIESAADLLYMMNWDDTPKKQPVSPQIPLVLHLSDDEQMVVNAFRDRPELHLDELCYATQFHAGKISTLLLQLEFANHVRSLPGKMYRLNR